MIAKKSKSINFVVENILKDNIILQINPKMDVAFPYLIGKPGGGKTATIKNLAEKYNAGFISTHFALVPFEELGGIPNFEKIKIKGKIHTGTKWSFPSIIGELFRLSEEKDFVIWLLDDLHLCGSIHMSLLYELLTERKIRDYKIPRNVAIVMAGNDGNKTGAKMLFSAIVNRVMMLQVHTDINEWDRNYAIPNEVNIGIRSFLKNDQYTQYFHEEEEVDSPWGSPRSWSRLSEMINQKEKIEKINSDLLLYLTNAHVGKTAASSFVNYYKIYRKFDFKQILKDAEKFTIPDSLSERYSLGFGLTNYLANNNSEKNCNDFCKILTIYLHETPDIGVIMLKEIIDIEKILNKKIFTKIYKIMNEDSKKKKIFRKRLDEIQNI